MNEKITEFSYVINKVENEILSPSMKTNMCRKKQDKEYNQ